MANEEHLAILKQGVQRWNYWRERNPHITPNFSKALLSEADLRGADLRWSDLREANLWRADLREANLWCADLRGANLSKTSLNGAHLLETHLQGADLTDADLWGADLSRADLRGVHLSEARLWDIHLRGANLSGVNLRGANLSGADLSGATFCGADLSEAVLQGAILVGTNFQEANLTGCAVYGISAWDVNLVGAQQADLVITPPGEPVITVDNLEVAQFLYLLLHNEKIRHVIEIVTSKAVLILGRFTPERKAVLDAIREALRLRNYVPILFDFEGPQTRDFTETISTLARLARFIIADLTEPSSLPKELEAIVPTLAVPVQPVLAGATSPYSMFQDYWKYQWVLQVYHYECLEGLMASLGDRVIAPAEAKVRELTELRRAQAGAQLTPRLATG